MEKYIEFYFSSVEWFFEIFLFFFRRIILSKILYFIFKVFFIIK